MFNICVYKVMTQILHTLPKIKMEYEFPNIVNPI